MALDPSRESSTQVPYLALAGPTASGKTTVAMALARQFPIEIISVDSALVYRSMDIGTAKPSTAERAEIPHHLIDICDPVEAYSAARFAQDAKRLITRIRARGKWPLLVGGTMLYFKALSQGLDDMPSSDPAVRRQIAQEAAEKSCRRCTARCRRWILSPHRASQAKIPSVLPVLLRSIAYPDDRFRAFNPDRAANITRRHQL